MSPCQESKKNLILFIIWARPQTVFFFFLKIKKKAKQQKLGRVSSPV